MNKKKERCEKIAEYMIKKKCTVRQAADHFGICKTTIHNEITFKLMKININLYSQIRDLMNHNWEVRHIRGGESTRKRYEKLNKKAKQMP